MVDLNVVTTFYVAQVKSPGPLGSSALHTFVSYRSSLMDVQNKVTVFYLVEVFVIRIIKHGEKYYFMADHQEFY